MIKIEGYDEVLADLMQSRGIMTQADLAEVMGVSQQDISRNKNYRLKSETFTSKFARKLNLNDEEKIRLAVANSYGRSVSLSSPK